jgi:glycosyltransferase 2 family protein
MLAAVAVLLAGQAIVAQWNAFRASGAHLEPRWALVGASSLLVLLTYALLIETWRRTVRAWDSELSFTRAARIWCISNLGRYLPGKVWQIGAMGVMAQAEGVSPVAATGSALLINLVNLLAGFGVVLVTGADFFDAPRTAGLLAVALAAGILAAPRVVQPMGRLAGRLLGRPLDVPALPARAVWLAAVGCLLAWLLYGVAFQLFVAGLLGAAPGRTTAYIAAFTGSYLLGYIALFAPGGIGVREGTLIVALGRLGLAQAGAAGVISVASRLWLTVLEVLPGLGFLALDALFGRRNSSSRP